MAKENEKRFNTSRAEEIQAIFAASGGPGYVTVEGTTHVTPGTEVAIAHTSGKVPTGFIVLTQDKAASVYKGSTAFTATNIYVKSDVASVAVKLLLVFI